MNNNQEINDILSDTIKKLPKNIDKDILKNALITLAENSKLAQKNENTNMTNFDGQPFALYCGNYICTENEIYFFNSIGLKIKVCTHPIIINRRFKNVDTGEYKVEIQFKKDNVWKSLIVDRAIIASTTTIVKLATHGISVTSENAKQLISYLAFLEDNNLNILPEQKSVSSLGWTDSGDFCPFFGNYILDSKNDFFVIFNSITECGDYEKWLDIIKKVRAEKTEARFFLAASFASILIKPLNLLPFFVHAWGMSGCGKTVMLMLAASVWANPIMGEYITTFNATNVGQELTASFLNNLPMCIDELQIKSSVGQTKFDEVIYNLCEGSGRIRGTKNIGVRPVLSWKNCFLTTGEYPIINSYSTNGSVNRVLEFECSKKAYSNLIELVDILTNNYGFAGKKFAKYLQNEENLIRIKTLHKDFYMQLTERNVTEKQAASAALLLATDKIVTELLFNDNNALTIDEIEAITIKNTNLDTYGKALEYIYQLVARNPLHFLSEYNSECKLEVWGKIEKDYIYIIKSVFDEQLQKIGINPDAFLSWAKKKNIIKVNQNRRTLKKYINGSYIYTIAIQKSKTETDEEFEINENEELPF